MDEMVLVTQEWLNDTYGFYDTDEYNHRFVRVEENGLTGWDTIYALTRALQIELGITDTADNFGPTTQSLFQTLSVQQQGDPENNQYAILQGALWCKGYTTGNYGSLTKHFYDGTESAVINLKTDAGLTNPNGDVTLNVMKALLSMDAFVCINEGVARNENIRLIQQYLNRNYENYIGLRPCDGEYGRGTNTALIYAIQAEEGLPTSVANGNFGPTTKNCCPTIPYNGTAHSYSGSTYSASKITSFTRILQYSLYCNGFGDYNNSGAYDSATQNALNSFQTFFCLPVTGTATLGTWLSLLISSGDTSRSAQACDCATILTTEKAATLASNGYSVVGRYLTMASKALTVSEIEIIFAAGLRFFPIYQTDASEESYFTASQGSSDAAAAVAAAQNLGIPYGTVIYFAVDFDAMDYQITDSILNYFWAIKIYFNVNVGGRYKIGVYGSRNICSRVAAAGYSESSFVGDMSTGFSGNIGFNMPDDWAFDQFSNVTIGSGTGRIEIDKDGYSGRDTGVSFINYGEYSNYINRINSPTTFVNRSGVSIPVYSKKVYNDPINSVIAHVDGNIIGYIQDGEFYTRFHTGSLSYDANYTDENGEHYRWILDGDYIHPVIFRNSQGKQGWGYIQEQLNSIDYNKKDSSLANQKPFSYCTFNGSELVDYTDGDDKIFTVKNSLDYYNTDKAYLGTLKPGTKLLATGADAGESFGWCMRFPKKMSVGATEWIDVDADSSQSAYVNLGYTIGTIGSDRAIW